MAVTDANQQKASLKKLSKTYFINHTNFKTKFLRLN